MKRDKKNRLQKKKNYQQQNKTTVWAGGGVSVIASREDQLSWVIKALLIAAALKMCSKALS
jgi:hypothetical protein